MDVLYALALSGGKEPPLIDIDGTFFIQLVVFICVAYILSQLLFKPFLAVRSQREAGIQGSRTEAGRLDEEARARLADYEQKIGKARKDAQEERLKLHGEAVKREREIQDESVQKTQKVVSESRTRLEADAAKTRQELLPRAREIAETIAKKVLTP